MHELEGRLHDGQSSRGLPARLAVYADGSVRLSFEGGERTLRVEALAIPGRLGDTPRRIALPDGGEFETGDNAAVDALLAVHGRRGQGWLHWLESRLGVVIGATLVFLAALVAFGVYGVPALARQAAFAVSPELAATLGRGTLELLDRSMQPSQLDEARRAGLRERFARVAAGADDAYAFELLFRGGGPFGANAFALPSGSVVVTDELVALAGHDEEIEAVLAHEAGHVVHRHGLRQAIQSSLVAVVVLLVTGDLSSTSGFVVALPALLAEQHFSRDFEREADEHAIAYLREAGVDPERLAELLLRLEQQAGGVEIPFLSSHPSTAERVQRLRRAGRSSGA